MGVEWASWGSNGGAVAVHSLVVAMSLHPLAVRNLHLGETVSANSLIHRLLNLLELILANLLLNKELKIGRNSQCVLY